MNHSYGDFWGMHWIWVDSLDDFYHLGFCYPVGYSQV
jgi:hypothetical protein